jgi:phosphoribosylformylglycinamidine synthase subunit PurL
MTAYEMMLSESQERMLMVLRPEKEAEAKAIFDKWDLDFAIVGETIPEDRFLILHGNAVKADLPLSKLSSQAPEYDRPWVASPAPHGPRRHPGHRAPRALARPDRLALPRLEAWVWEQYDSQVMADTVRAPGLGAGVVRVHGTGKMLAFTSDVTPRYVKANPVEGGKQAVAEAWRNLVACGATPLAATDNLNFGNPEKPEIMGQLVGAIRASARPAARSTSPSCRATSPLQRNRRPGHPAHPHDRRRGPHRLPPTSSRASPATATSRW